MKTVCMSGTVFHYTSANVKWLHSLPTASLWAAVYLLLINVFSWPLFYGPLPQIFFNSIHFITKRCNCIFVFIRDRYIDSFTDKQTNCLLSSLRSVCLSVMSEFVVINHLNDLYFCDVKGVTRS